MMSPNKDKHLPDCDVSLLWPHLVLPNSGILGLGFQKNLYIYTYKHTYILINVVSSNTHSELFFQITLVRLDLN